MSLAYCSSHLQDRPEFRCSSQAKRNLVFSQLLRTTIPVAVANAHICAMYKGNRSSISITGFLQMPCPAPPSINFILLDEMHDNQSETWRFAHGKAGERKEHRTRQTSRPASRTPEYLYSPRHERAKRTARKRSWKTTSFDEPATAGQVIIYCFVTITPPPSSLTELHILYTIQYALIVELAVEGQANGLGQQTCVLVACGVCDNGDVATGDHLRGVASTR